MTLSPGIWGRLIHTELRSNVVLSLPLVPLVPLVFLVSLSTIFDCNLVSVEEWESEDGGWVSYFCLGTLKVRAVAKVNKSQS
jgi:hypothetical protein